MDVSSYVEMGKGLVRLVQKKLYLAVVVPAIYITYKIFQAITKEDSNGNSILNSIIETISSVTKSIEEASDNCPQLIGDFTKFLDCLGF